jgi:hypothetical protein
MNEKIIIYILLAGIVLVSSILLVLFLYFRQRLSKITIPAACWTAFLCLCVLAASLCLLDLPGGFSRLSLYLLVFAWFVTVPVFFLMSFMVPALLILDLIKRHSPKTSYLAWGSLWMFLALMLAFASYDRIRMNAFERYGKRVQPLIDSLERYRAAHGKYPKMLASCDPRSRYNLCRTGMSGYTSLRYVPKRSGSQSSDYDSYKLILYCPIGILGPVVYMTSEISARSSFKELGEWKFILMDDRFEYWSGRDYPAKIRGGTLTRLGGWAYFRKMT